MKPSANSIRKRGPNMEHLQRLQSAIWKHTEGGQNFNLEWLDRTDGNLWKVKGWDTVCMLAVDSMREVRASMQAVGRQVATVWDDTRREL
jgi:hypothetical protein